MKTDNLVRKRFEAIVARMGYRSDKAAPVETFWDTPGTDTCFDILVLTYNAGAMITVGATERNAI